MAGLLRSGGDGVVGYVDCCKHERKRIDRDKESGIYSGARNHGSAMQAFAIKD